MGCVLGYDQSDDFSTEDPVSDGARLFWENGSLLDVPADLCGVLSIPRLTPPVIDDYFVGEYYREKEFNWPESVKSGEGLLGSKHCEIYLPLPGKNVEKRSSRR